MYIYSENIESNRLIEYIAKPEIENVRKQIEFHEFLSVNKQHLKKVFTKNTDSSEKEINV